MIEGFFKVFASPAYGSYYEDRAHANLFNRSENLYRRIDMRRASEVGQAMSTIERLVATKATPAMLRGVEVVFPWPIGSAVLTDGGLLALDAASTRQAVVDVRAPHTVGSGGIDSTIKVSPDGGRLGCLKRLIALEVTCVTTVEPPELTTIGSPTPEWLLLARRSGAGLNSAVIHEGAVRATLRRRSQLSRT